MVFYSTIIRWKEEINKTYKHWFYKKYTFILRYTGLNMIWLYKTYDKNVTLALLIGLEKSSM